MTKILLLLICCLLLAACSVASKSNTLEMVRVEHESEIEALPVAADLRVLEQKTRGEASGKLAKRSELEMEALAKAAGQRMPLVDGPDLLVGANLYTETTGDSIKVIITGYPAYYANFRTATEHDLYRLNIAKANARPIPEIADGEEKVPEKVPQEKAHREAAKPASEGYFTFRYMLPVSEGVIAGNINIGGGWAWKSGNFFGLEIGGTPSSVLGDEWSIGGGMNFGRAFDLQYVHLFGGLSAGFWLAEKRKEIEVARQYNMEPIYEKEHVYRDKVNVLGVFAGVRWSVVEFTYRMFPNMFGLSKSVYPMKEDGWHHQLMVGVNI
jgi:hypothetical protein